MPSQLKNVLWEIAGERGFPIEGFVFVNGKGNSYSLGQVYIPLRRIVKRFGMPWFHARILRKVVATEFQERSDDVRLAQLQLGHSRITTTERYLQRSRKAKLKAAQVLEELGSEVDGDFHGDLQGNHSVGVMTVQVKKAAVV